ncbi:MAG: hypothetical protein P9L99_09325 [Candidatus Lernaella stagnicola]|nr:hypothetical protein [Candidatus Lernaella stagnicola]
MTFFGRPFLLRLIGVMVAVTALLAACQYNEEESDNAPAADEFTKSIRDEAFAQFTRAEFLRADVEGFFSPAPAPANTVNDVAPNDGEILAATNSGLIATVDGAWRTVIGDRSIHSIEVDDGVYYLGTVGAVLRYDGAATVTYDLPGAARTRALAVGDGRVFAASEDGVFELREGRFVPLAPLADSFAFALYLEPGGRLWAATADGLLQTDGETITRRLTPTESLLSVLVRAVIPDGEGGLWIGTDRGLNHLTADDELHSWTGAQGLPYPKITALARFDQGPLAGVWVGTERGVAWLHEDSWRYFAGRRWLPHDHVTALAGDGASLWVATTNGMSQIRAEEMTLAEKADVYLELTESRHVRFGLVSASDLDIPGDLSTFRRRASRTDAFSTSLHLAALSFAFAATEDGVYRETADEHFAALNFLEEVTPREGLIARSIDDLFSRSADPDCAPFCDWQANRELGVDWLSDADAASELGFFFAAAVYFDLAATPDQQQQVAELVSRLADHLLENDFQLIDWDGEPTTWGNWNPDTLWRWFEASNPFLALRQYGQVLPNSLEILSFLKTAYHITGEDRYEDAYRSLIQDHALDDLVVNAAVRLPVFTNHQTDQLIFLAFYPLLQYETDHDLRGKYLSGLENSFAANRVEQNSLFDFIYGALTRRRIDFDAPAAVTTLREMPLDLLDWRMENSERADVDFDLLPNRLGEPRSSTLRPPLPAGERPLIDWGGDPFALDGGGLGTSESPGTFWNLAYWLARYHGIILP